MGNPILSLVPASCAGGARPNDRRRIILSWCLFDDQAQRLLVGHSARLCAHVPGFDERQQVHPDGNVQVGTAAASHPAYGGSPSGGHAATGLPAHPQDDTVEFRQLADVLRFDATTPWIFGHWSRVSTALAEIDLQGYRVALITGTGEADLAGSLTYYFNKSQVVQRITLHGTTGDARPLVGLLTAQHGFTREMADDPSLFLYRVRKGRTVRGELRIKPAPIVRKDDAHARFDVSLVMDRPDN